MRRRPPELGDPLAAAPPTIPRSILHTGSVDLLLGVPVVRSAAVPPGHTYLMATGAGPVMLWPSEGGRPWWRRALAWLATGARWAALPWWVPPA